MYLGITPLLFLGGIVGFWIIVFLTALILTRRFLRGVGERLPEESGDSATPAGNGGH
ncbi:MAG TPA: hypothetical protein VGR57_02265 [Ktedonobacterales bacterium]|nr:hypothetical protein [Ktedonobacterales bacterium]